MAILLLNVPDGIHGFVQDSNDENSVCAGRIENYVTLMRKAVVTGTNVVPVAAHAGIVTE